MASLKRLAGRWTAKSSQQPNGISNSFGERGLIGTDGIRHPNISAEAGIICDHSMLHR